MYKSEHYDWTNFYGDVQEELPKNMPKAKGRKVKLTMFADTNLYHDRLTGRSLTGLILMANKTPVDWYSKKQISVESATYGSKFVAARIGTDKLVEMRYDLRMLGVPIEGPSIMFGDNMAVINSASIPESNLKKRHNALSYHCVREAIAANVLVFYHIKGTENLADILTKFLPRRTWYHLMKPILHWTEEEKG